MVSIAMSLVWPSEPGSEGRGRVRTATFPAGSLIVPLPADSASGPA